VEIVVLDDRGLLDEDLAGDAFARCKLRRHRRFVHAKCLVRTQDASVSVPAVDGPGSGPDQRDGTLECLTQHVLDLALPGNER